jgi:hypothetical protein
LIFRDLRIQELGNTWIPSERNGKNLALARNHRPPWRDYSTVGRKELIYGICHCDLLHFIIFCNWPWDIEMKENYTILRNFINIFYLSWRAV